MNSVFLQIKNTFFSFGSWFLREKFSICPKNNGFPESLGLHAAPSAPWLERLCRLQAEPQNAAVHNPFHIPSIPIPFFPLFPSSFPSLSFPSSPFLSLPLFTRVRHGVGRGGGRTSAPPLDPPLHTVCRDCRLSVRPSVTFRYDFHTGWKLGIRLPYFENNFTVDVCTWKKELLHMLHLNLCIRCQKAGAPAEPTVPTFVRSKLRLGTSLIKCVWSMFYAAVVNIQLL